MKAKRRNYSVCALMVAVFLAMAMLVTGCVAEPSTETGYKPPAGMGAVRLSFNKTIQRTILPDDIKDITDFPVLGVIFEADDSNNNAGNGLAEEFFTSAADVMAKTFTLEFGDYIIKVIGYLEEGEPDDPPGDDPVPPEKPAAIGEVKLTIDDEKLFTESVTLYAITDPDATEKGLFSWAIDVSDFTLDFAKAEMTIAPIATPSNPAVSSMNLVGNWTSANPIELNAGYYFVFFELEVEDLAPVLFRHVLHIYQNQESKFTYKLTDDYFIIIISAEYGTAQITIDYNPPEDKEFKFSVGAEDYEEGDTVTVTLGDTVIITLTNASDFADDSIEWYCNGETSTGASFEMDTSDEPFDEAKVYLLSVIGVIEGDEDVTYGSYILIKVEAEDGP
jgi:hypothetical protein